MILQFYDVQKFFDKEMIEDGLLTCIKRGADPKAVRLWYKLNEGTRIQVRLGGIGMSESKDVGAVVGQGTIGGALVSQAVLDDGVQDYFQPGGKRQLQYGSVPLAPVMFQDDLLNGSNSVSHARETNIKVDSLMKERGLSLNRDKSVFIVLGTKQQKEDISKELKENRLMCGDFETKEVEREKWLGQVMSAWGLADSVAKMVAARLGKIKGACLEIAQIVSDWRFQIVGGMDTALLLWEACCIPPFLNGAGTWVEISEDTERKLNSIQYWFIRLILQVGPGAPKSALLWDFGLLDMSLRIWIEKVMLVLHVRRLEEDSLARIMYKEQMSNKWPGLANETEMICRELGTESVHDTKMSKPEFRSKLIKACHDKNAEKIMNEIEGKMKCDRIAGENCGKKSYSENESIKSVREKFKTRFGMQPFAGNFSKDRRFASTNWLCRCKMEREDEAHLLSGKCDVYGQIRKKYSNLDDDDNLVRFFNEVLAMRDVLDERENQDQEILKC